MLGGTPLLYSYEKAMAYVCLVIYQLFDNDPAREQKIHDKLIHSSFLQVTQHCWAREEIVDAERILNWFDSRDIVAITSHTYLAKNRCIGVSLVS